MLYKMALKLSGALADRGIFSPEDIVVYSYGLELLMSTAINILLIVIISFVFMEPLSWLFFLLPFIPLRITAGGYHAKTHLRCCITFAGAYTVLLLAGILTAELVTPVTLIGVSVVCLLINLLLSPVPAANKPLEEQEKRRNRRRSLVIASLSLLVTAFSLFAGGALTMLFIFFTLGQLGAAVSLIVAKILHN